MISKDGDRIIKVNVAFYLDEDIRKAIRGRHGDKGMATKEECKKKIWSLAHAGLEQILSEYDEAKIKEAK